MGSYCESLKKTTMDVTTNQDFGSFEDALRRLNALELKLTEQVKIDIKDLKKNWILPKVDRVTKNAFRLYKVREQLLLSKSLFFEEENILKEFYNVKEVLTENSLNEEDYEATKSTCLFLGTKLQELRKEQKRCYEENQTLENFVNKEIMTLIFENKDFAQLDIERERATTPVRKLPQTPIQIRRSRSREPSPLCLPPLKISSGKTTPLDINADFFSNIQDNEELRNFRKKFEAKQTDDDIERPSSAMSEMSLELQDDSRPASQMSFLGDIVSSGNLTLKQQVNEQKRQEKDNSKKTFMNNHNRQEEKEIKTEFENKQENKEGNSLEELKLKPKNEPKIQEKDDSKNILENEQERQKINDSKKIVEHQQQQSSDLEDIMLKKDQNNEENLVKMEKDNKGIKNKQERQEKNHSNKIFENKQEIQEKNG